MQQDKKETYYIIVLLILSFVFFFFKLWSFSLFDVDEPRYAEAAREMIESNNWITPYFNYVVRFDKPVLFYWLIAVSYKVFGISEFAARFPSALMATLIVFAIFFFGKKHIDAKFGFICSLIILTSIQVIGLARMSITDMTLSAFITFMLLSGFTAAHALEPQKKFWWYAFYIFMALGMLTKGPIVPAIAVIVLGPYFILTGKFVEVFKTCQLLKGSLLFLLIAAPWYILVIMENGQPYIDQFFLKDNLQRFVGTVSGHSAPFYFFFIVILVGFLPWSTFLPFALFKYVKPIYLTYKNKSGNYDECSLNSKNSLINALLCPFNKMYIFLIAPIASAYKDVSIEKYISIFSLLWFLIIFIFFSASGTKLLTYVLPLFPALGLLVGNLWYEFIEKPSDESDKYMLISSGLLVAMFLILSYLVTYQFNSLMPRDAKVLNLNNENVYCAMILSLGTILTFIFIYTKQRINALASIIVMMVIVGFVALYGVVPKVNNAAQGHLNKLINVANNYPGGENAIITCGLVKPSIIFYTRKQVKHVEPDQNELLLTYLSNPKRIFIITRVKFLDELYEKYNVYIINKGKRFALITNKPYDKEIAQKLLGGNE